MISGSAQARLEALLEQFIQETQMFPEVVAQVQRRAADAVQADAVALAQTSARAAASSALDDYRSAFSTQTKALLEEFLKSALKERQRLVSSALVERTRLITLCIATALVVFSWLGGMAWGWAHPRLSSDTRHTLLYGKEFVQMYPSMPQEMQQWIERWTAKHPVE